MIMRLVKLSLLSAILVIALSGCSYAEDNTNYFESSSESSVSEESFITKAFNKLEEKVEKALEDFDYKQKAKSLPESVYDYDVEEYMKSTTESTTETLDRSEERR